MISSASTRSATDGVVSTHDKPVTLSMRGIVKRWPRQSTPVLDRVDFDAVPGTVTWIGGRNGAGKTTLLRIAAGLIAPDAGSSAVEGLDPERQRRAHQRRIGFLSGGNGGLYARLTVASHLEFWSKMALVPRSERRRVIESALNGFALEPLADRRVDRMSMGQRQRVRLAMTFLHEPALVLLDEPRNSLDEEGMAVLVDNLRDLTGRGGTAIWCSPTGEALGFEPDVRMLVENGRLTAA